MLVALQGKSIWDDVELLRGTFIRIWKVSRSQRFDNIISHGSPKEQGGQTEGSADQGASRPEAKAQGLREAKVEAKAKKVSDFKG